MSHHFRAFTFVDRILAVRPGVGVSGCYAIPAGLSEFSSSLVAEATGQLAAWAALAAVEFKSRPVAGIAGLVEVLAPVRPGEVLELAAQIESVDMDAIAYGGTASVNGSPVLRLHHCVGPMLPAEQFDDPRMLRDHYALLSRSGTEPGVYCGLPTLPLLDLHGIPGTSVQARLAVPKEAPFFADHFPRKPVFPGSLLMQCNLKLVETLAGQLTPPVASAEWRLESIVDMKLRSFIPPGEILELEAKVLDHTAASVCIAVETKRARKLVGAARVNLKS